MTYQSKIKSGLAGAVIAAASLAGGGVQADTKHVSIGTGGQTGVYYVVGQSICKFVNRDSKAHGLRCSAPSTGGSIANLNSIRDGGLDMGVAQSDWQFHAYKGSSKFEGKGAFDGLRAVFSVHAEPFTVVARADSGITSFDDLPGKRLAAASALSTIVHPAPALAPSMHTHISYTELRDGSGYWRMMTDLNPSHPDPDQTARFRSAIAAAAGPHFDVGAAQGDRYFYIPALERHRGVAHFYLEQFDSGDFDADGKLAHVWPKVRVKGHAEAVLKQAQALFARSQAGA